MMPRSFGQKTELTVGALQTDLQISFAFHLHLNELSLICDMWLNKITYLLTYLLTSEAVFPSYMYFRQSYYKGSVNHMIIIDRKYVYEGMQTRAFVREDVVTITKASSRGQERTGRARETRERRGTPTRDREVHENRFPATIQLPERNTINNNIKTFKASYYSNALILEQRGKPFYVLKDIIR